MGRIRVPEIAAVDQSDRFSIPDVVGENENFRISLDRIVSVQLVFQRPKPPAEGDLSFGRQRLIADGEDLVGEERLANRRDVWSQYTMSHGKIGVVMLPIIRFSVDWFDTLHQRASVVKAAGPAIHSSILIPLLVMATGFSILFLAMHLKAMRNEILRRRAVALEMAAVRRQASRGEATAEG